ncbi:LysR substrate-binding domain-containing protein [Cupriavidus pauculus]|uniref:LysR substrate-binding domain-containing protein n=1 Tax=Cupriavidus pauculus TaxID=82633 RepID=UPI001D0BFF24|nr:LysR substrate-binding domain-containing protein [Cupriavidus pauculus]
MKLHNLRDFVAVAQTGSLRAAARKLELAQPSLSKSIQQLETELGATLFERNARGAMLTPAGKAFLLRAQAALNELKRGQGEVRQISSGTGGSVSMAVSAAVALSVLPDALKAFSAKFPDAAIRIMPAQPGTMLPELRAGALDFAIGPRPSVPLGDDYSVELLMQNRRAIVCRREHPLRKARRLRDLLGAQWLVSSATGMMATDHDQFFQSHGLDVPPRVVQCDYGTATWSLLASTDMLAVQPRQWVEAALMKGVLTEILIEEKLPSVDIVLVRRRGLPPTPAAETMLSLLQRHIVYYAGEAGSEDSSGAGS